MSNEQQHRQPRKRAGKKAATRRGQARPAAEATTRHHTTTDQPARPQPARPTKDAAGPTEEARAHTGSAKASSSRARDVERGRLEGALRVLPKGFGFVDGPDGSVRLDARQLEGLLDGDVLRVFYMVPRAGRLVATRVERLERPRREVVGVCRSTERGKVLEIDPGIGVGRWEIDGAKHPDGALLRCRVSPDGTLSVVERLAEPLDRFLIRHGFTRSHRRDALDEARRLAAVPVPSASRRRDLRSLRTFTIDADHSKDLDDAVSAERGPDGTVRVWVHISDVAELVRPGSRLDREAREAATSVYLPNLVRPMLPAELSEERLSLLPGVERDTLTVEMLVDASGTVRSCDVYESTIVSDCRLSYVTVARHLSGRHVELDRAVADSVSLLHVAASRLGFARRSRGGTSGVLFDEVFDDGPDTEVAHVLIERLMVAANEAVGAFLVSRGLPGIFRVHDAPSARDLADLVERFADSPTPVVLPPVCDARSFGALLEQFRELSSFAAFRDLAAGVLGAARYDNEPGAHFALGSDNYLHFTSPIRRYADVAVHRVLKAFLAGGDPPADDLAPLAGHVSERSTRSSHAERDARAFVALSDMAVGRRVEAAVLSMGPQGARVRVESCPAVGTVERKFLPAGAEVGRRSSYVVSHVDPISGRFELRPAR